MKRTINEIYRLLNEKLKHAKLDKISISEKLNKIASTPESIITQFANIQRLQYINGNIDALQDVICLIESSHLVESEVIKNDDY